MRMAARALYRGRQFFEALRPRIDGTLRAEALRLLHEPERRLFESMTPHDQRHCLDVYRRLRADGQTDRDLLVAALLHDVGKGRVALWHRVAYVLLEAWTPGLLDRLAKPGDGAGLPAAAGYRQALYRCRHHVELGGQLAREAGCSDTVVALIRADVGNARAAWLEALRNADDTA